MASHPSPWPSNCQWYFRFAFRFFYTNVQTVFIIELVCHWKLGWHLTSRLISHCGYIKVTSDLPKWRRLFVLPHHLLLFLFEPLCCQCHLNFPTGNHESAISGFTEDSCMQIKQIWTWIVDRKSRGESGIFVNRERMLVFIGARMDIFAERVGLRAACRQARVPLLNGSEDRWGTKVADRILCRETIKFLNNSNSNRF